MTSHLVSAWQANELNNLLDQQEQAIWDGGAGGAAGAPPPGVAQDAGYGSDVWAGPGQEQSPYGTTGSTNTKHGQSAGGNLQ